MKVLIVGGYFGSIPKKSSVIKKLNFDKAVTYNSGTMDELREIAKTVDEYDLVIWMPDISNIEEDVKFKKRTGTVVIVSKVMREDRSRIDAVTRIFKFHGNAVISISKSDGLFNFELIDALDNTWITTNSIPLLIASIIKLYNWTKNSVRIRSTKINTPLDDFISLNRKLQIKSAEQNIRYFGNLSTRCTKLFPTTRTEGGLILVSARNVDKSTLISNDMIQCTMVDGELNYIGDRKPSVDSPIQLTLYEKFPNIHYFIHGHSFIKGAVYTKQYYPCGDMREVPEIEKLLTDSNSNHGVINLKNHGFLIYSDTLHNLCDIISKINFEVKEWR